jgi:putative ABC transport system permease protein
MKFILNMAWREMRASWRRLALFFLCIAIGVGSIVSLRSLVQKMRAAIGREARVMYACDVQVGSNQPWEPKVEALVERYFDSPLVAAHTEVTGTQMMIRSVKDPNAPPVMVLLLGVQEQYPLYGEIQLTGGARYTHSMLSGYGTLLPSGLMTQLGLKIGDEVNLGPLTFTVRGAVENMPGYGVTSRPLPRVVADYADAAEAGLTEFSSSVWRARLFKAREGKDQTLLKRLERDLKKHRSYGLGSFRGMQSFANQVLERMESQLSFAGLVILILGGIGISSVTRVFIQQKMKTIAILKCLGGDNRHVLGAYLAQAIALCVVGSLLGLLFAGAMTLVIPRLFDGVLPFQIEAGLTWRAALQGVGVGALVTLLFLLPPLLQIRLVKPMLVMRQNTAGDERRIDWLSLGVTLLIVVALFALTSYQASSLRIGGIFIGMLVGTALVLNLIGAGLMRLLRRAGRLPSFVLRQGVGSLYRPGNQTKVILIAVGLGTLFVTAMRLQQANLMRELNIDLSMAAVDMYLLDIQIDQRQAVEETVTRLAGAAPEITPIVRTRLVEIKRAPDNTKTPKTVDPDRFGREQRVTYKSNLAREDETVVAGKLWEPTPSAEPEVSVEYVVGRDYNPAVGDLMTFDLGGRRIAAKVTSVRRRKGDFSVSAAYIRFGIIFRPGALEDAPQTFVSAFKGPPPGAQRAQLQRELVDSFPNVLALDVYDHAAFLRKKINDVSLAVNFLSAFIFLCGVLILTGSVVMTKIHRLYEAAILKTLGAEKKLIVYITLIEYGVLGLLAGVTGSTAAIALTWLYSKYGIKAPWQLIPSINLIGVAAALLLVMTVGVFSNWEVMTKKPLGILREE